MSPLEIVTLHLLHNNWFEIKCMGITVSTRHSCSTCLQIETPPDYEAKWCSLQHYVFHSTVSLTNPKCGLSIRQRQLFRSTPSQRCSPSTSWPRALTTQERESCEKVVLLFCLQLDWLFCYIAQKPLAFLSSLHWCSEWGKNIPRPFALRYDAYTQSVEVLNDKKSLKKLTKDISFDIGILQDAMSKLP